MARMNPFNTSTKLGRWLPLVVWIVIMFIGSSIPQLANDKFGMPPGFDKVIHAVEYLVLAILFCRGFGVRRLGESVSVWLLVVAICMAIGAVDELHQVFIPGRNASPVDFGADLLGIAAGTSIGWWWLRRGTGRRAARA